MTSPPLVSVCLPCWRRNVSMTDDPPQRPGFPEAGCVICSRRTNHGIYLSRDEAMSIIEASKQ